jgi:hypothetical protein
MPDVERLPDTIARYEKLRDDLRDALDDAKAAGAGTVAQLAAQYRAVCADLLVLDPPPVVQTGPVSKMDELKERRARRDADEDGPPAAAPARPARAKGGKRGA